MRGKEGKCRSFRKNNFLYFRTAPYSVNINSFQRSFAMIVGVSLRMVAVRDTHTDPTKLETSLEVELSHDWCCWKSVEYSAVLILHATSGTSVLTECTTFLLPGPFGAAEAIRDPH